MKNNLQSKFIVGSFLLLAMILLATPETKANTYNYASIGYGETLAFSAGRRQDNVGFELGFGMREYSSDLLDYPCPHYDYQIIEENYTHLLFGADVLGFKDFSRKCALYGGLGIYLVNYQDISRSNLTGWVYEESSSTKVELAYSAGIHFTSNNNSGFGLGYHSIRGANVQFIVNF